MEDKKNVSIGVTTTADFKRLSASDPTLLTRFNTVAIPPLPLALRQEIVERLLNTRQIVPAENVSRADILKSLETPANAPVLGVRQVLAELVIKGLVTEVKSKTFSTHKPV